LIIARVRQVVNVWGCFPNPGCYDRVPDAEIMEFHKTNIHHKGTKITKIFESSLFFVFFVNFGARRGAQ